MFLKHTLPNLVEENRLKQLSSENAVIQAMATSRELVNQHRVGKQHTRLTRQHLHAHHGENAENEACKICITCHRLGHSGDKCQIYPMTHSIWHHYALTKCLTWTSSFQAGGVRVPVTCRPSTAVPRRQLQSSIAHWPSSLLCWHQNLCRSPNKQTLGPGTEVSQTLVQNMEQSAVNILNPTCLMRFETEALRYSCF